MKKLFCLGLASVIPLTSIPCFNLHRTISAIETTALISNLYSSVKIVEDKLTSKNELVEVNLQIPVLQGLSDLKLQKKINSMFKTDILSFKNEIEEMAKEYSEQAEEHGIPTIPYTAVTTYKVTCIKGDLLSLYIDYYQYTGGAHGITFRKAYNIDLTNGNKLTLKASPTNKIFILMEKT